MGAKAIKAGSWKNILHTARNLAMGDFLLKLLMERERANSRSAKRRRRGISIVESRMILLHPFMAWFEDIRSYNKPGLKYGSFYNLN